jgi:uncharacterized membrane protein YgcG
MRNRPKSTATASQRGFALMMVMFLTTLVLIGVMAAAPYVRTERRREKEEEMIWRGKQYVRGIKLYYRKTGRFPTSVDDLTKPKLGSLRFMRQAYTDPMNKADGSWRLIYVGPSGQLIGSLKPQQTFQMPGPVGTPAGANPQQTTGLGAAGFGQSAQGQGQGQAGVQPSSTPTTTNAGQPGSGAGAPPSGNAVSADDAANATPSGMVNGDSPLMGGNIIGVGSKTNKRSIIVYDKATNYRLFEFIWNPSKDLANALNQQMNAPNQNPQGTAPGQTGFGQSGFGQSGFGQGGSGQSGFGQQNNSPAPQPGPPTAAPPPAQNPPQQ